jgi:hypothetical protein
MLAPIEKEKSVPSMHLEIDLTKRKLFLAVTADLGG